MVPATGWARRPLKTDLPHHGSVVDAASAAAMTAERTVVRARDVWSFLDTDRDGAVTAEELVASGRRWHESLRAAAVALRERRRRSKDAPRTTPHRP